MSAPTIPAEGKGSDAEARPDVDGSSMPSSPLHPTQERGEQATSGRMRLREPGVRPVFDRFDRWLATDPTHPAADRRAERMFEGMRESVATLAGRERRRQGRSRFAGPRPRFTAARWGVLAAILAAPVLMMATQKDLITNLLADAVTRAGETERLALPDGTWVTLNTDTAVRYEVADGVRRVRLDRGEAFFDVARDPSRPFFVESGDAQVRVLGTHFNVRREQNDAAVSVTEGRVALSSRGTGAEIVLTGGQQGRIVDGMAHRESEPDGDLSTSWRRGQVVYYSRPLSEVLKDLARYRNGPILVVDDVAGRRTLSGVFDVKDPEQAIRTAAATVDARIAQLPGGVLIVF